MNETFEILVVCAEAPTSQTLRSVLERRGHRVTCVQSCADALGGPRHDVVVCDLALPDGDAFELLNRMRGIGLDSRAVLLAEAPTADTFRRALLSGDAQILLKPIQLERLVALVEDEDSEEQAAPLSALPSFTETQVAENPFEFQRSYELRKGTTEQASRDLCAFALRIGVGPSGRCRLASAVAEVLDNSMRHAYAQGDGRLLVTAFADEGKRLSVVVQDFGCGFEPEDGDDEAGGLARAAALCESLRVDSSIGSGTRIELGFEVWPVRFEGDDFIDLSELDWLPPALTRKVLARLEDTDASPFRLSPALMVTVGRLLAARQGGFDDLMQDLPDGTLRSGHGG